MDQIWNTILQIIRIRIEENLPILLALSQASVQMSDPHHRTAFHMHKNQKYALSIKIHTKYAFLD